MKKAFLLVVILFVSVISTACINNFAVQELNNKAKGYLQQGDYENAIGRLESSLDLDSTIFETHYNLGIAYVQAEKYPEAIATFQNAIKLKPEFADTYYSIAVAQENYAKAIVEGNDKNAANKTEPAATYINKPKVLSQTDKAQVIQLLTDAISNYGIYLNKGKNIADKQDVEQKVEYLKTQVAQYSLPTASSTATPQTTAAPATTTSTTATSR